MMDGGFSLEDAYAAPPPAEDGPKGFSLADAYGAKEAAKPEQPKPDMGAAANSFLVNLGNHLLGSFQRTVPVDASHGGTGTYEKAGDYKLTDAGPMFDPGNGQLQFPDPTKHVVLLDDKGQPQIYKRTAETNVSLPIAAGGLLLQGAMAPATAPTRVGEPLASAAAARLADLEASGITPSVPAVMQSRTANIMANTLKDTPIVGAPITRGTGQQLEQAAARAGQIADQFGTGETPVEGGEAAIQGARQFRYGPTGESNPPSVSLGTALTTPTRNVGFVPKSEALYKAIPIGEDTPATLDKTVDALNGIGERFATNPDLGKILQNPKFAQMSDALKDKGLTWSELQDFRSFVGKQMRDPSAQLGAGRDEWRNLYGALSEDMKATASAAGPEAIKAWQRANNYYRAGLERINDAMGFLKKADDADKPEQAYNGLTRMAQAQGAGADINKFTTTMKSMPDEFKGDIAATMINRMGTPVASQAGAAEVPFSIGTWATNWAKMSDKAKDAAFGSAGSAQRDSLESLSRSVNSLKNVERLANTSGTGRTVITTALLSPSLWLHLTPAGIGASAAGFASNYGAARFLMSPGIARWMASASKAPDSATPGLMARLKTLSDREHDAEPLFRSLSLELNKAAANDSEQNPQPQGYADGGSVKKKIDFQGLPISIEVPKGHYKHGKDHNGKPWKALMPDDYGYIRGTKDADNEATDVHVGPHLKSPKVWVVDQIHHHSGKFDEHKVFTGYTTRHDVIKAFDKSHADNLGPTRRRAVVQLTIPELKHWLGHGDLKKPIRTQMAAIRAGMQA